MPGEPWTGLRCDAGAVNFPSISFLLSPAVAKQWFPRGGSSLPSLPRVPRVDSRSHLSCTAGPGSGALLFHAPWGSPLQPSPVACSDSTQPLSPCWPSHRRPDPHSSLFSSHGSKPRSAELKVRCKMTLLLIRNSWRHSGFT